MTDEVKGRDIVTAIGRKRNPQTDKENPHLNSTHSRLNRSTPFSRGSEQWLVRVDWRPVRAGVSTPRYTGDIWGSAGCDRVFSSPRERGTHRSAALPGTPN